MKQIVSLELEVESDNPIDLTENLIMNDIEQEFGCCWHTFEIKKYQIKEVKP